MNKEQIEILVVVIVGLILLSKLAFNYINKCEAGLQKKIDRNNKARKELIDNL